MAGQHRSPRAIPGWLLWALFIVPVLLACSGGIPVTDTAPAHGVHFHFNVTGMFSEMPGEKDSTLMRIEVVLFDPSGRPIAVGSGQRLSCDGQTDPVEQRAWNTAIFTLPRRPAGQAYDCVYTDEHGVVTALPIPVPRDALAVTAPKAASAVAIVPYGQHIPIRYTFPAPPGYVLPRVPDVPSSTASVATVQAFPSATPAPTRDGLAGPTATIEIVPGCGTGAPGQVSACPLSVPPNAATGTVPATGTYAMPVWGYLHPGPGYLFLNFRTQWSLLAVGVARTDIQTTDFLTVPITWMAST